MKPSPTVFALVMLAVPPLHAQVVNDGASRTLINETNSFLGDVTIGTNGITPGEPQRYFRLRTP